MYNDIAIHPLLFQDDVLNPADNLESAQSGNDKMEDLIEDKLLYLNLNKCFFLLAGNKRARTRVQKKVEKKPVLR